MSLNFELSEEHRMIKKTVRDIVKSFASRKEEFQRMILKEEKYPEEVWRAMAEAGVLGCLIPEEYGGSDLGLLAMTVAFEELAANGLANTLMVLSAMDSLCILRNGDEAMKRRFLPKVADGSIKLSFALTEPDAGSNAFRISTHAKKDGDKYRITGQKTFITGVDVTDYMLLVTRTLTVKELEAQGLPKTYGLSLFMVDTKSKGIELQKIPTRGIEGLTQWTVFLDDVEVPAENLIGQEHNGTMALFSTLNPERILAGAAGVGASEYVLNKAVEYAKTRVVFGKKPIGALQAIQHPLAEVKIEQEAARLMVYKAAWTFDTEPNPGPVGQWANMGKFLAAEMAIKAVDRAIETLGGYGFSEEYGIIPYWEGMRLIRTAPITREMILNFIGEHVLGLPRSY